MEGLSLAKALKSPEALGGPWKVYGSTQRPMPTWFPSSVLNGYISFDATDDTGKKLGSISNKSPMFFG
ncbi:hypothetical protein PTKIN_Ptkin10aG0012100 [Pterospermum kingtungense]